MDARRRPAPRGQGRPARAHARLACDVLQTVGEGVGVPGAPEGQAHRRRPRTGAGLPRRPLAHGVGRRRARELRRGLPRDAQTRRRPRPLQRGETPAQARQGRPAGRRIHRPAPPARPRAHRRLPARAPDPPGPRLPARRGVRRPRRRRPPRPRLPDPAGARAPHPAAAPPPQPSRAHRRGRHAAPGQGHGRAGLRERRGPGEAVAGHSAPGPRPPPRDLLPPAPARGRPAVGRRHRFEGVVGQGPPGGHRLPERFRRP